MCRWRKLGRLFQPLELHPKLISHAANPLAIPLSGSIYRIYYSGRDQQNRSSVGYIEADVERREIVRVEAGPVFEHGGEKSFYSHGVSLGCWYEVGGQRYILFMGWQNTPGQHWRGDIGRLLVHEDGRLILEDDLPLLASDAVDPISLSYPWVRRLEEGSYRMWYGSTVCWDVGNGEMLHVINYADSADGHSWQKKGLAVPFELGRVQAFSRPTVAAVGTQSLRMWFSYRGDSRGTYRIGHAVSPDGEAWSLHMDQAGIDVAESGWDSKMIEYPFVFEHKSKYYMLYNGNDYGRTGFGIAVLER